jgi:hypothetical protein
MNWVLALLCQFLAARSIIEVAIRPLNHLTEQAKFRFQQGQQGERLAAIPIRCRLAAASPLLHVGFRSIWPIEIWYGEELTE